MTAAAATARSASIALPVGVLLIAIVSIQAGASIAKQLFPAVGAAGVTALRLCFAALMLLAIWRPWRMRVAARDRGVLIIYGLVLGAMNLMFYLSLRTLPLGLAVALEFTGPLGLAVIESRRPIDVMWVGLAVIGMALLLPIGAAVRALDPVGVGFALGAGVCWALYIVFGQKAGRRVGAAGPVVAYGSVVAALAVTPFGVVDAGARLLQPGVIATGLLVALTTSAIPYSLEMIALRRLPRRTFGILMSLEPALGSVTGLLMLGERLSWRQILAVGLVVVASGGAMLSSRGGAPIQN